MDKLRKIPRLLWKDRLWANNIAKRESDLLKTNEANLPPPPPPTLTLTLTLTLALTPTPLPRPL